MRLFDLTFDERLTNVAKPLYINPEMSRNESFAWNCIFLDDFEVNVNFYGKWSSRLTPLKFRPCISWVLLSTEILEPLTHFFRKIFFASNFANEGFPGLKIWFLGGNLAPITQFTQLSEPEELLSFQFSIKLTMAKLSFRPNNDLRWRRQICQVSFCFVLQGNLTPIKCYGGLSYWFDLAYFIFGCTWSADKSKCRYFFVCHRADLFERSGFFLFALTLFRTFKRL